MQQFNSPANSLWTPYMSVSSPSGQLCVYLRRPEPPNEHEDAEAGAEEKSGVAPEEGQQDVAQLHGGCIQGRRGLIQRQRGGFRVGEGGFSDRGVDSGAERSGRKRH
eukprot:597005-Prorocentrum_minimum.AAC.1